jgi:hypothetical protein
MVAARRPECKKPRFLTEANCLFFGGDRRDRTADLLIANLNFWHFLALKGIDDRGALCHKNNQLLK